MEQRARIIVRGVVQGVFFRDSTRRKARELGVTGIVKNLPDGTVQIVCEGEEGAVKKLIEWSGEGPKGAFVTGRDVTWENYVGEFKDFTITY